MKLNKYKMGLVVVVIMILTLPLIVSGCGAPAGDRTPDFLRVGGSYNAEYGTRNWMYFTVVEMRRDGWILCDEGRWINTTQLFFIEEREESP